MNLWLNEQDLLALWLSLKLALVTTILLLSLGMPLAWWLSRNQHPMKIWISSLLAMPLVLPPTVLGFYLLVFLGPKGPLAALGGQPFTFTFTGLVIGSMLYSLPFVLQPMQQAFSRVNQRQLEVAATLGAAPLDRFISVVLPIARPGLVSAAILGFAHTLGEFGVVLMIGGSLPGKTKVVSIVLYEYVDAGDYASAHRLAIFLAVIALALLFMAYRFGPAPQRPE